MNTSSWVVLIAWILVSLSCLAQAETTNAGVLSKLNEEYELIKQKIEDHCTKLYKSNGYNFARYSPEEDLLIIGLNSQVHPI